jgi:AcrR family transcriptional regulator
MDGIAHQAGVTKPTRYAHFGSKEALYRATLSREANALQRHLLAAYDASIGQDITNQARADTLAFFDYAQTHHDGFLLLFGDRSAGPASEARSQLTRTLRHRIAELIGEYRSSRGAITAPSADQEQMKSRDTCHSPRQRLLAWLAS